MKQKLAMLLCGLAAAACAWGAPGITINGTNSPVITGTSSQFTATLTEVSGPVQWSVNGVAGGNSTLGTITSAGLYKAPATVPNPNTLTIGAAAMGVSATKAITVTRPKAKINSWNPYSLSTGPFTMTVSGTFTPDAFVTIGNLATTTTYVSEWYVKVSGTVAATDKYKAAISVTIPGYGGSTYTSSDGVPLNGGTSSGSGGNNNPPAAITIAVSPATATVVKGATQQFNASVQGTSNTSVTWSVTGGGTISTTGLYTAPAAVPNPAAVTITATSAAEATKSATATVTVVEPAALPAITAFAPAQLPFGAFLLTVNGSNFNNTSKVNLGGVALTTTYVSPTQLTCTGVTTVPQQGTSVNVVVSNGGVTPANSQPAPIPVGVQNPVVSASAAMRFLEQAAFGPKPADVMHVQQIGFQAWLNEQFATPTKTLYAAPLTSLPQRFLANAVNDSDQLRQRLAFTLSQFFVISINKLSDSSRITPFQQMLYENAFTTYPNLLTKVTLDPAMGVYLDMVDNDKANPATGSLPNENYAREILQLFSIGTVMLGPDGTPSNVPTYNQAAIAELARAFTGWTYGPMPGAPMNSHNPQNFLAPMVPTEAYHDTGAKTLFNGTTLPAGQSAQADLTAALQAIVAHPNVAPFVSKFLIQHLVTSAPSSAYVQRVANVFNNNGQGLKGDMKAVVTAILLDQEARAGDNGSLTAGFGRLQSPLLFVAGILRAFDAAVVDNNTYFDWDLRLIGQDLYNAPSVFNFYSPQFRLPGGILAPEFQIFTPWAATHRINLFDNWFGAYQGTTATYGSGAKIELGPFISLSTNAAALVDALDAVLTRGQMPAATKTAIANAVAATNDSYQPALRKVQAAAYLIATSAYYQVRH